MSQKVTVSPKTKPRQTLPVFEFEIDTEIDINSMVLRDMVAIDHVVREETRPRKETSKATQQVTTAPNWNW